MKDVEKFKELLETLLEEFEKPVIKCKEFRISEYEKYGVKMNTIYFKNKNDCIKEYDYTLECIVKDNMLITDDFIFIKEE